MTPEETARVLAKAAAFDQRTIGTTDVLAWHEVIGRYELADCLRAVTTHYTETRDRAMPADIRRLAVGIRDDRQARERQAAGRVAIESAPTVRDRSAEVTDMLTRLAERLGPSDPAVLRRREWVEHERQEQREQRAAAEPNPHFAGLPPPGGWPVPDAETA